MSEPIGEQESRMASFDEWKAELEAFMGQKLEANEIAWAKWLYERDYGPWNAYIAYQRRSHP